ncbi:MAG: RadC family protein [Victivallaceae bacterium]
MDAELTKGHRERLRKKYLQTGISSLHDYEQLELLLTFVIARKDVKPVAKSLLKTFKTFSGVFDAPIEELRNVEGIGENTALMLKLVKDLCGKYLEDRALGTDVVANPAAVIDFARMALSGLKNETFMIIYLNVKNHIIDYEASHGTVDYAAVYPRNIIQGALRRNATAIILVHNHPSGHCDPSKEDITLTSTVKTACKTVNITLLDHIIVSKSGYTSLAEKHLIN